MDSLGNIRNIFLEDLKYKFSIVFNEINTCHATLNYFVLLNANTRSFFSRPFDSINYINELFTEKYHRFNKLISEYNSHTLENDDQYLLRFFEFLEIRASFLSFFEDTLGALGIIQKAVVERIDSVPPLYPPPPTFRQKEIFKALLMIERYSDEYQESIFELFEDSDAYDIIKKPLTIWNHSPADRVVSFESQPFISSSYWHMLLPEYLPILAHEVAHHYVRLRFETGQPVKKTERITTEMDKIATELSNYLKVCVGNESENFPFVESILHELLCDLIALKIAGIPYFLSLLLASVRYPFKSHPISYFYKIENFPFVRLEIMRRFINSSKYKSPDDKGNVLKNFLIEDLRIFFEKYYELLREPCLEGPFFKYSPDFYEECKTKYSIETFFVESLSELFIKNDAFRLFQVDHPYDIPSVNEVVKNFCVSGKSAGCNIDSDMLKKCNIEKVSDIPFLIWYFNISKCIDSDGKRKADSSVAIPIGRLSQECFRLVCEKSVNAVAAKRTGGVTFHLGEVVEVLFMKIRRFINDLYVEDKDLVDIFHQVEENNKDKIFYNCIGIYDGLFITCGYSIRSDQENWPLKLKYKDLEIPYFPRSDVFQEILIPGRREYLRSIREIANFDSIVIYQLTFKNDRSLGECIRISSSLIESKLRVFNKGIRYLFLKSMGWEDLVVIFCGFDNLEFIMGVKETFKDSINMSMTTLAYKHDSKKRIGKNVDILSSIKLSKMSKAFDADTNSQNKEEQHISEYLSTGQYDLFIKWNLGESKTNTLSDFRRILVEKIHNKEALDTNSRIILNKKAEDK